MNPVMTNRIEHTRTARVPSPRIALLLSALLLLDDFQLSYGGSPLPEGPVREQDVVVLHTYDTQLATEVANTIPVDAARLTPLLPQGYEVAPASTLGLGGDDEGLVVIFNFYGADNSIDHRQTRQGSSARIDLLILVHEPAAAGLIGADVPGAFHFYTLALFVDDAEFAASLRSADMPVEFVPRTLFDHDLSDAGEGTITVDVPSRGSPFYSHNTMFAHAPVAPLNGFFWHESEKGTAALHFQIDKPRMGQAVSLIYTEPGSPLNGLLTDEGFGPGPTDPETGYPSIVTPSLNLSYPHGSRGRLWLIERAKS